MIITIRASEAVKQYIVLVLSAREALCLMYVCPRKPEKLLT